MKKTLSQTNKDLDLRRFGKDVYTKASQGGEITADDITPKLLENEDVLERIHNWGLSDEEISMLHTIEFDTDAVASALACEENMLYAAHINDCIIDNISRTAFDEVEFISSEDEYKYLLYGPQGGFTIGY